MYVAPGLLDERLTFYARSEDGAHGFPRPVYTKTGTYWGRVDATASQFTPAGSPQGHIDARTTLTATVADYVAVDPFGIVKVGEMIYFVRSVVLVRQLRGQQVTLEAIDPTAFGESVLYDPAEVKDGVHLVLPATGFTTGFNEGFQ